MARYLNYRVHKRNLKWCIVEDQDDKKDVRVVTIEQAAGSDDDDCLMLAKHLATAMNQMRCWS